MKQKTHIKRSKIPFIFSCLACCSLSSHGATTTIFSANFDGSTAATGTVTANATVANLNAGTSVGSWALNNNEPGAIISDSGSNNALAFDLGVSTAASNRATGLMTSAVDLAAGDTLAFQFDIYASRQGSGREVRLALTDSGGTIGGSRAYVLIFDLSNTKGFSYLNTNNGSVSVSTSGGANSGFANPSEGSYLSWSGGTSIRALLEISAGTTLSDTGGGPPTTGAKLSIDWNGNGSFAEVGDGDVASVDVGPRDGGVSSIDRFELFYGGTSTRGAYFDNFEATLTTIPEPSGAILIGGGLLSLLARRRRGQA